MSTNEFLPFEKYGRAVSDIFNEYAAPAFRELEEIGGRRDIGKYQAAAKRPWEIWNAVVSAEDLYDLGLLTAFQVQTLHEPQQSKDLNRELFQRKRGPFEKYKFIITDVHFYSGEHDLLKLSVKAEVYNKNPIFLGLDCEYHDQSPLTT